MYVCLCNAITDRELVEAAVESSSASTGSRSSAEEVVDRLGAGLGCGACRAFAVEIVERAAAGGASVMLPSPFAIAITARTSPPRATPIPPRRVGGEGTVAR